MLGCFDRLVVIGTLTEVADLEAMTEVLYREGIRCFDIGQFAEPFRGASAATRWSRPVRRERKWSIFHAARGGKNELVTKVLARRGNHPGLVHVFSGMDAPA